MTKFIAQSFLRENTPHLKHTVLVGMIGQAIFLQLHQSTSFSMCNIQTIDNRDDQIITPIVRDDCSGWLTRSQTITDHPSMYSKRNRVVLFY